MSAAVQTYKYITRYNGKMRIDLLENSAVSIVANRMEGSAEGLNSRTR